MKLTPLGVWHGRNSMAWSNTEAKVYKQKLIVVSLHLIANCIIESSLPLTVKGE